MSTQSENTPNKQEDEITIERHEAEVSFPELTHTWIQQGYEIRCTSCEQPHGSHVGPDVILVGQENGIPKFEKRFR